MWLELLFMYVCIMQGGAVCLFCGCFKNTRFLHDFFLRGEKLGRQFFRARTIIHVNVGELEETVGCSVCIGDACRRKNFFTEVSMKFKKYIRNRLENIIKMDHSIIPRISTSSRTSHNSPRQSEEYPQESIL